jgi:hypothetical protein
MAGALEPALYGRFRVALPRGDVLAGSAPRVAGARDAVGGRAAVGAVVPERAARRHVERVQRCRRHQSRRHRERRGGLEPLAAAARPFSPRRIHEREHALCDRGRIL